MLDMYSDFTMHHAQLGVHVELLEMDDLETRVETITSNQIEAKLTEIQGVFEIAQSGHDRISLSSLDFAIFSCVFCIFYHK